MSRGSTVIKNIGSVGCILCRYGMTNAECELFFQSLKALKNNQSGRKWVYLENEW